MQVNQDKKWMKIALKYAYYAEKKGEVPVGSILVLKEKIIGIGWNSSIINNDPTAHAEIIALRQAGKNIKNYRFMKSTLYVTLQPCMMCFGAIIESRITKLVFGASYQKDKRCPFKDIFIELKKKYKLKVQQNVMEYECSQILSNFFKSKRK